MAQPVSVTFDFPVTDKAAVEKHLKVTTDNGTAGAWGWVKDFSGKDRVDWRPKEYWRPGTKVGLRADLNGVDSGGGRYFAKDYDLNFTIGDRHVITVDLDSKQLTFTENGKEVKDIPFSAGKPDPRHSTWTGIFPLMAKEGTIIMDSGTAGPGDADGRTVRDAMKLTSSGTYAHAAPWNAGKVGRVNDSSGCIGLTDADATGFTPRSASVTRSRSSVPPNGGRRPRTTDSGTGWSTGPSGRRRAPFHRAANPLQSLV